MLGRAEVAGRRSQVAGHWITKAHSETVEIVFGPRFWSTKGRLCSTCLRRDKASALFWPAYNLHSLPEDSIQRIGQSNGENRSEEVNVQLQIALRVQALNAH